MTSSSPAAGPAGACAVAAEGGRRRPRPRRARAHHAAAARGAGRGAARAGAHGGAIRPPSRSSPPAPARSTTSMSPPRPSRRSTRRSSRRSSRGRRRARQRRLRRPRLARSCSSAPSRRCAPTRGSHVEVVAGMSFCDLAWERLGIDPVEARRPARRRRALRRRRGRRHRPAARRPGLVSRAILSAVKLAVDPPPRRPCVLHHLGLPDEQVVEVAWSEIDRTLEPDHLTWLYVPELAAPVARELARLDEVVRVLRERCPWDREQTHRSLVRHLLEETYEAIEAIEELGEPPDARGRRASRGGARRPALPGAVPRHARGRGGAVHPRRRGAHDPRQARAPPPARLRRRHRCRDADAVLAQLGADQAGGEGPRQPDRRHPRGAAGAGPRGQARAQGGERRARLAGDRRHGGRARGVAPRRHRRRRRGGRSSPPRPRRSARCCSASPAWRPTPRSTRRTRCAAPRSPCAGASSPPSATRPTRGARSPASTRPARLALWREQGAGEASP